MYRFLHIFIVTCLLSLGLAEASERVMPELTSAVDVEAGDQHLHHDSNLEHSSDDSADVDHCVDCCHVPCFWLAGSDFKLSVHAESLLIRPSLVRRFTSQRPPLLFRPPIV